MKLVAKNTPSGDADLSQWMEHQVVSEHFGEWITELTAIGQLTGVVPKVDSLEALLGGQMAQVLERGLADLPREKLRILLQCPQLLVNLQRRVFINGGNYWNAILMERVVPSEVEWQRTRIALFLGPEAVVLARNPLGESTKKRPKLQRSLAIAVGALILCVVAASGYWIRANVVQQRAINSQWSMQEETQLLSHADAGEYLSGLARFAEQWFSVRPRNEAQLKLRLDKLKANIQTLTNQQHGPLNKDDQKWLIDTANKWMLQCDGLLSKTSDFDGAMQQSDALCLEMIDALYRRSAYAKR